MNTTRTDHGPMEIDNREAYRQRLITSRRPKERIYITDEPWLDTPIGVWEALGLVLFVMAAFVGLAEILPWVLR